MNRIVQVTPGVMPIPTNGWGAVEKIIWEYKKQLDFIGYETVIEYADDVVDRPDQIVHVHMANLANLLHERGIDYVYSLHDHHTEHFGRDSQCYKDNYTAIKNAKVAFVHSPHLVEYFDKMPNIVYLQHGANLKEYDFQDRSESIRQGHKLVMMANNGLGGDPLFDRKGFLIGIEAARKIDAEITIICPSSNKKFFDHHSPDYQKLSVLYDLNHEEAKVVLSRNNIFLNPSSIEAGHPNLTVTEAIASGLPVVGTSFVDMPGVVRCQRDIESVVNGILECAEKYDSLVEDMRRNRYKVSWEVVVTNLVQNYKKAYNVSEKKQLLHNYKNTTPSFMPKSEKNGVTVEFTGGKAFVKTSLYSEGLSAVFRDLRTNRILYETKIGKTPGEWAYIWAPGDEFIQWEISVNYGVVPLHVETLSLRGKKVLMTGPVREYHVRDFEEETGAFVTTKHVEYEGVQHDADANDENFYTTYTDTQMEDYFAKRSRLVDNYILILESAALGDTIGFIPYAQEWASINNISVDVVLSKPEIFDHSHYPNLRMFRTGEVEPRSYNHIYRFEYQFDKSLQKGYCEQFGLDYVEIQPRIKKSGLSSPSKNRYAVLGVQTTAQCKYWNRPNGWNDLCKLLKKDGITPVSVDKYESFGIEGWWNLLPESSLKKVGMDFNEVIRWIEHCDVFIGVSSGLAWLAYGLGKKVVMITGTTAEGNEFEINNTVVSNRSVCNGCFNRPDLHKFNSGDWLWCPKHKGTERHFECTKTITPEMVMAAVKENM